MSQANAIENERLRVEQLKLAENVVETFDGRGPLPGKGNSQLT